MKNGPSQPTAFAAASLDLASLGPTPREFPNTFFSTYTERSTELLRAPATARAKPLTILFVYFHFDKIIYIYIYIYNINKTVFNQIII